MVVILYTITQYRVQYNEYIGSTRSRGRKIFKIGWNDEYERFYYFQSGTILCQMKAMTDNVTPPMNGLKSFGKRLKFRAVFNSAESGSALYKKITITVDSMKLPCLITEEIEVVGAVIEVE